jgi:hypothetical protein
MVGDSPPPRRLFGKEGSVRLQAYACQKGVLIPASCRGLREPACKTNVLRENRVPASLGRRGYAEIRDLGNEMRCIERR